MSKTINYMLYLLILRTCFLLRLKFSFMKKIVLVQFIIGISCLLGVHSLVFSQTIPLSRSVNWKIAGLRDTTTANFQAIDMQDHGAIGDGISANDTALANVLTSISGAGAIIKFPNGNFLFNHTITLPANCVIRGNGAANTIFTMNQNGTGNSFEIDGTISSTDTTKLSQSGVKDSTFITVFNPTNFAVGNWILIQLLDTDLVTSAWAANSVGQIVNITSVNGNRIGLASPLRMDYNLLKFPHIHKMNPKKNVGIECLKIDRIDSTAPEQSSNFHFLYAVNCWVNGIESNNCTFAHIDADLSSNLSVSKSYFHHAFHYGASGRGYGVLVNSTTNECRIEDNVFEHLRHSMILQSGANGNVFAYNYSFDPLWETSSSLIPPNSAGDIVLHGNYPYANLFEGNICQNIVIDDSHGANGPYNTFFRNRAESFGIFFSATTSPSQNIIGNDVPNNTYPYNMVNYTIQGVDEFSYGNNNKGTIDPVNTEILPDSTYAYSHRPDFFLTSQWVTLGTPNIMGSGTNPAHDRYLTNNLFANACGNSTINVPDFQNSAVQIYPNPMTSQLQIESNTSIKSATIFNQMGQQVLSKVSHSNQLQIDVSLLSNGFYFVIIRLENDDILMKKAIKL